jgi:hypothetical protein
MTRKYLMTIDKSLADYNPELSKSWHPYKNGTQSPHQVSPYSNKCVWWKCEKGHEWQATISNRTGKNKTGCPYCSGSKPTADRNLAVLFPEVLKEWHYPKNNDLNPENISPYSHKKVWWKCEKGHEWQTGIAYRTKQKSGCPYCSGRAAGADNSLQILYPDLAREWHPTKNSTITPNDVRPGSDSKIWWLCDRGHSWQTSIYNRTHETKATRCPFCSGRYATKENNLASLFPELLDEWHLDKNAPHRPDKLKPGSNRKVWWKCKKGHEWKTSPNKRTGKDKTGCPHCQPQTSRLEIRVLCELMYLFDEVKWRQRIDGIEADIYVPAYSFAIEVDGYPWHVNREDKDKIKGISLDKHGIKLFRLRDEELKLIEDSDTIFKNNEDDIDIVHRLFKTLLKYVSFDIEDRNKVDGYIKAQLHQNDKEYKRFLSFLPSPPSEYSLAALYKDLVLEWDSENNDPLKPEYFTPGSAYKAWWKCSKGHIWESAIGSRTKGVGCPFCAGKKVADDNSFAFLFPALVKEWHPQKNNSLTPNQVYAGTTRKVWWRCVKGHEWKSAPHRRARGEGCPYCSGRRVSADNNLLTLFPEIAKEWYSERNYPLRPEDFTAQSHKKVWWKCVREHEWEATIGNRTGIQKSGCPYCAGQKVSTENNLLNLFPEIAKEWHFGKNFPLKPDDYAAHSSRKVWWHCTNKHEWEATISNRTGRYKQGCPYCAGRYATEENNLAMSFPELLREWDVQKNAPLQPDKLRPFSNKKVWWRCSKGHEWKTGVIYRTKQKSGCPYCALQKISKK